MRIASIRRPAWFAGVLLAAAACTAPGPPAADAPPAATASPVVPGPLAVPYPTIRFVTLEWPFAGDENGDARVTVRFRAAGAAAWRAAMPLQRVEPGENAGFTWERRFSGSLFDLDPDTEYEVELAMHDPDGGGATRAVRVRTRAVPAPMPGAPVREATPATLAAVLAAVRPGDVVELAPGRYRWPEWSADGTPQRPIVVRSSRGGAVVVGEIALLSRRHVHLSGLEVEGRIRFNGSTGIAITRCTIRASAEHAGDGIVAYRRAQDAYIADNVVTGLTRWGAGALGVDGDNLGEGIVVTGPGHVIEHNRVRGFRDGVSLMEQDEAVEQHSVDIVGNDIAEAADDGIEADFCLHNCRIVRNRLTDTFVAMSAQPSLGGPTWFVRNVAYNVAYVPFKLYRGSAGDVLLHNTVVKGGDAFGLSPGTPVYRLTTRNNLFVGGPGGRWGRYGSGSGDVAALGEVDAASSSLDHDAFGSTAIGFRGDIGGVRFVGLDEMRAATSERHGVEVDRSVFATPVRVPTAAMARHAPPDLRPRAGSPVHGRALPLPNVNERPDGAAPTIGAYEPDAPLPVYGPR